MRPPAPGRTEPPAGLLRRLDGWARAAFPASFTALLLILAVAPIDGPGLLLAIALPCVFFWSLFRPAAMPAPAVFLLGLLHDLLVLAPLGPGILALLLCHGLVLRLRGSLSRQGFLLVWLAFAAVAGLAVLLCYALTALLMLRLPPPAPGLVQFAIAVGLYPALALLLTQAHRAMERAEG